MTDIEKAARAEAEQPCSYCGTCTPVPVELHHAESDCLPNARREAEQRWPGDHDGEVAARYGFTEGASWLAEYLRSDENVEKAARAIDFTTEHPGQGHVDWPDEFDAVEIARAALSAVLGTNHERSET